MFNAYVLFWEGAHVLKSFMQPGYVYNALMRDKIIFAYY